ncbi:MAG: TonB-dependent receptor, partial [Bacteroidales bacterium]
RISDSARINFSYSSIYIPVEKIVSLDARDKKIRDILDELLEGLAIGYRVVENQIVLRPGNIAEEDEIGGKIRKYTVSGYIKDKKNGENLIGATVTAGEPATGTSSNAYGFYSLTLPEGIYNLNYSYVGYKREQLNVKLNENRYHEIELAEDTSILEAVVIASDRYGDIVETIQMSETKIRPETIKRMPALLGEVDVIKSLQSVPGIKFFSDGSTLFYVRGGNKDQNLILIDEAPIYNPAHFLGFFSILIPDAVKDVNIYKGDIPAPYGGRLSSLIDVKTRDGNLKRFGISGSTGFLATKLSLEGPFVKEKSSYFISGRRSQVGWLLNELNPDIRDLYFYDLNTKFNFIINDRNRLFVSFYNGKDYFRVRESDDNSSGIHWGNLAGTIRWNHVFGKKLFSNTTLYASKYDYFLVNSFEQENFWNSHIANLSLKTDFSWYVNPENTIRFGVEISGHNFNPGNYEFGQDPERNYFPIVPRKNARGLATYISNEQELSDRISFRYGLRLPVWQNIGEATEYHYDENYNPVDTTFHPEGETYNTFYGFEPRVGIGLRLGEYSSLRASYSRTNQYIQLITNSISPFTSLEVWLPSGPNIKPQKADQLALGYFRIFRKKKIDLSLEMYYKRMTNQIDYDYHAEMLLNPYIESELRFGKAWSYGIELLVKRDEGKWSGWIGYSWSLARRKTKGLHGNKVFPAFYDRPHDLSVYLSYDLSSRINIGGNWIYSSGAAVTTPTGFYYYQGYTVPIYTEKNNDRLPDYHRLDLSAEFNLNRRQGRFKHDLVISLFNVYERKNPVTVNFNKTLNGEGNLVVPGNLLEKNLVASQMYMYKIIPSLTYRFAF